MDASARSTGHGSRLLEVEDLTITFPIGGRPVEVVRSVSFAVDSGEMVGLVGESGSGKTMSALAVMRLVPPPGRIAGGTIRLDGTDLLRLSPDAMRRVRGARIAMVFQEPMTALNPVFTIGFQIVEALRAHRDVSRAAALREGRGCSIWWRCRIPAAASTTTRIACRGASASAP